MKKSNFLFPGVFLLFFALMTGISCKKVANNPDDSQGGTGNGALEVKKIDNKELNLPVDSGDIGLVIDTRSIFKLGYKPAYASIQINGVLSSYSDDHVAIDQFTNLAIISIPKTKLTKDEIEKAAVGPKVVVKVYDSQGAELANITESSLPINDKNQYYPVKSNKQMKTRPMSFNPEVPYLIQSYISSNGKTEVLHFLGEESNPVVRQQYDPASASHQEFYFIKANKNDAKDDSTYYIRTSIKGQNSKFYYLDIYNGYQGEYYLYAFNDDPTSSSNYKLILRKAEDGWVYIKPVNHPILKDNSPSFSPYAGSKFAKFKIVSAGIQWSVDDLGTKFNQPVMPNQKLELAVSSRLINCSGGTLSQTIGKDESRTQTTTASSTESFELTTSQEASISITTTVGAEGSFFGVGASASIGITGSYSYGRSVTNSQSKTLENSTQETKSISTSRTIEVVPGSGVDVYDAIESYPNVRVPFAQTLRIAGSYKGAQLTGDEIVDQLMVNQFGGVVSEVGSSYVLITVRGVATIDNYMNIQSNVREVPGACKNP